MRTPFHSRFLPRRFAWPLWLVLALLAPLAQTAAAWHALSHTSAAAGTDPDGHKALHTAHCDLCLVAAAIGGGALPATPPQLPHPAVRHAAPPAAFDSLWLAAPAPVYLSRAPPIASH